MVEWVLERFAPQVDEVLINANQNIERYAAFGHRVFPDAIAGFAGPLAGLHRGLKEAAWPLIATVPCDSPFLPQNLVARLCTALRDERVDLSLATTGTQAHPVFCLARARLLPHLERFLAGGGRKIDAWYADLNVAEIDFGDEADAFGNFNTLEELRDADAGPR
jgi:molybdopterin-guanine dinucleotide biosynthesis protein A